MIVLVDQEKDQHRLLQLCEKTAFGCKIASIVGAYGFDKGSACFWVDAQSDTIFCHSDDVMLISGTVLNTEETREFIRAVGPKSVMCAVRNAEALLLPVTQSGDVLKKQLDKGASRAFDPYGVNIREIYGLLEKIGMFDEFEPFYLDFSHKLRHEAALAVTEHRNSGLAGCSVVSSVSETSAIISAVAVDEAFRRQGIGSELIRRTESYFAGKTMYVFREKEAHREFYRKLDYNKVDTWVYSRF